MKKNKTKRKGTTSPAKKDMLKRGPACREEALEHHDLTLPKKEAKVVAEFVEENAKDGLRIFVAGGARAGNSEIYAQEAYKLGRTIGRMGFKLDFGLSSRGIMGAVARGVLEAHAEKEKGKAGKSPINAITTDMYLSYYKNDNIIDKMGSLIVAKTLEERKQMLLNADFVVFASGGLGTLDEMVYDCVAMQDGMLPTKPFIIFNVNGYFYHLMEYLKEIHALGFADRMPFIVVDNCEEAEIVFETLKEKYKKGIGMPELYGYVREVIYFLPYVIKQKKNSPYQSVGSILKKMENVKENGDEEENMTLELAIEGAYLEKEIERMYERLARAAKDVSLQGGKLEKLLKRKQDNLKVKKK